MHSELAYSSRSSGHNSKSHASPSYGVPAVSLYGFWTVARNAKLDEVFLSSATEMPEFPSQPPSKLDVSLTKTDMETIALAKQACLLKENLKARLLTESPRSTTSHSPASSICSAKRKSGSVASAGGSGDAHPSRKSGLPVHHNISSPRCNTSSQVTTCEPIRSSRQRLDQDAADCSRSRSSSEDDSQPDEKPRERRRPPITRNASLPAAKRCPSQDITRRLNAKDEECQALREELRARFAHEQRAKAEHQEQVASDGLVAQQIMQGQAALITERARNEIRENSALAKAEVQRANRRVFDVEQTAEELLHVQILFYLVQLSELPALLPAGVDPGGQHARPVLVRL